MRYIEKYLTEGMKVLEIGAGTGRYSHALARAGHEVTAVELVPRNIGIFNSKTEPGENVTIFRGNAKDLSFLADGAYDMTLLLGPMYHLFTEDDQRAALSEALRVTKNGGLLYAAYCLSDASILLQGFRNGRIFEFIEKGMLDTEAFRTLSTPAEVFQLYRKEDIDALMSGLPVQRLHYVAADLYTEYMRETVDAMSDEMYEVYLKYCFFLCERPDFAGITSHSLDILRKTVWGGANVRDGYNISILPLEEADAPAIIVWNENQTKDFLEQWSGRGYVYPLTEAQIQARIVAQQSSDYRMYRIDRDGEMIGTISLLNIKPGEKKASIGHFLLNPGLTGKGLGTAALKEFVAMVFRETVFEKLTLTVFDFNKGAYRCYEKAGFIETDRSARPNGWVAVSMELEDLTFC